MEYQLTDRARQDLLDIADYSVHRFGRRQTERYLSALQHTIESLMLMPTKGMTRDELISGLRSYPCISHSIYYLTDSTMLTVIRILHQSMDPHDRLRDGGAVHE